MVLSGLFRYTDSDYPFGISKLFLGEFLLFLDPYIDFHVKNDVRVVFILICVVGGSCFMLFVFMYAYSCPTRLPCHMRTRVA